MTTRLAVMLSFSLVVSLFAVDSAGAQTVLHVPGGYSSIQDAHDAALDGDIIDIASGTFNELVMLTKDVTLQGAGQGVTVLDGGGGGTVITVQGATVAMADLTVTNGASATGGGGIRVNGGTLELTRCTVTSNTATGGGAGIAVVVGALYLTSSLVSDNIAGNQGGGIWLLFGHTLELIDTTVTGNEAFQGGGIFEGSFGPATVTLIDSHVDGNRTSPQTSIVRGVRTMTIIDSTIDDNVGDGVSGGESLTIANSSISRNTERGVTSSGLLMVTDSTVDGNATATRRGGVLHSGALAGTITGSTISNNVGFGVQASSAGGLEVTNSTVSGNHGGSQGGGFLVAAPLTLRNATVVNNSVTTTSGGFGGLGGGIHNLTGTPVTLVNSILANNVASVAGPDCFGDVTSNGHNLVGATAGCTLIPPPPGAPGDVLDAPPLVDVLADNGGPTRTHALLAGSQALDAGDAAQCPPTDQRGVSRTFGICDMGAYELDTVVDSDNDGILDDEDSCPASDLAPTIVVDGCDSGVPNFLLEDGCTASDLIADLANGADHHGSFVRALAHLTNSFMKDGFITGAQKGSIQSCGGHSSIP